MTQSIKTYEFTPSTLQKQTITIAFCMQRYNELHELYVTHFVRLCSGQKITCKPLCFFPTDAESMIEHLRHTSYSFIVCLDNQHTLLALNARAKLSLGAPILSVDWQVPPALASAMPSKCFTLSLPMALFARQLCSVIQYMSSIKKIGILYCPQDTVLVGQREEVASWLTTRNYEVKTIQRMATITGSDVVTFSEYDLLIFLCRTAPEDYMRRLATVCAEQHTTLYVTNPIAISYGASCTFGPNMLHMATQSLTIIYHYLNGLTVPPHSTADYELQINKNHTTDSLLSPLFMSLAEKAIIANPSTADKVSAYLRLEQVPLE